MTIEIGKLSIKSSVDHGAGAKDKEKDKDKDADQCCTKPGARDSQAGPWRVEVQRQAEEAAMALRER